MAQTRTVPRDTSRKSVDYRHVPGWGADLDPGDRPGVPRERALPVGEGMRWPEAEIPQQKPSIRIFLSVERHRMTPVQGTSCPPRGLSGVLRAFAYRFGEARLARWLPLLLADRVDVLEGYLEESPRLRRSILWGLGALAGAGLLAAAARAAERRRVSAFGDR